MAFMLMDLRVYVSSTSIDLKEYRAAVISALRKMGATPVCMEDMRCRSDLKRDWQCQEVRYEFKPVAKDEVRPI